MRTAWLCSFSLLTVALIAAPAVADDKPAAGPGSAEALQAAKKKAKKTLPLVGSPGFETTPQGGSRIFVPISSTVKVTEHASPGQLSYVIEGAKIDVYNSENALELYYFNTPALRAKLRRLKKQDIELSITLRAEAKATFLLVENKDGSVLLQVDFPPGSYNAGVQLASEPGGAGASHVPGACELSAS